MIAPARPVNRCPYCGGKGRVVDSDQLKSGPYYRRRKCKRCDSRWSTHEKRVKQNR